MIMHSILSDYHDWMLDKMQANLPEHRKYSLLLTHLDERPYIFSHPYDENREIDGKYLRQEFLDEEGIYGAAPWDGDASILEVLVAMSIRIETEITGEVGNDKIERWFWVMIKNLGLDFYVDRRYDERKVDQILDNWLEKRYGPNDKHNIFPLRNTNVDPKDMDLWHQMQLYLSENYNS